MGLSKWDKRFLKLSNEVASWSKDPSTQVGAVITKDNHVVSLGFNGFPRGMRDDAYLYEDREVKYERVIHAEVNAILNAHRSVKGCTLYVNRPPCAHCALNVIQSGIIRVVAEVISSKEFLSRWQNSMLKTRAFFEEAEIEYVEVFVEEV